MDIYSFSQSNKNVLITVVLPNFNDAKYLPTAIDSLIEQTTTPYEVLLVDDCSTDNSLEIMQSYAEKHSFIKIHKNSVNLGVYETVRQALHFVNGTHVIFLAADDWFLPNLISEAIFNLKSNPSAAFWSSGSWSIHEDDVKHLFPTPMNYPRTNSNYISATLAATMLYKIDSWFAGNTVVYNTQIFKAEFGPNMPLNSFADNFLYRVLACKYGCCFTPKRLSVWRIRSKSMSQTTNQHPEEILRQVNLAMELANGHYKGIFSERYLARMKSRLMFTVAKSLWLKNNGSLNQEFKSFLYKESNNKIKSWAFIFLFYLASYLPMFRTKLGIIITFLYFKPFDLLNLLKLRIVQPFRT